MATTVEIAGKQYAFRRPRNRQQALYWAKTHLAILQRVANGETLTAAQLAQAEDALSKILVAMLPTAPPAEVRKIPWAKKMELVGAGVKAVF